jgi:hypothetical protein
MPETVAAHNGSATAQPEPLFEVRRRTVRAVLYRQDSETAKALRLALLRTDQNDNISADLSQLLFSLGEIHELLLCITVARAWMREQEAGNSSNGTSAEGR